MHKLNLLICMHGYMSNIWSGPSSTPIIYLILFGLWLNIPVNSYGHVESSTIHTFPVQVKTMWLTSIEVDIVSLVTDNSPSSISGRLEGGE